MCNPERTKERGSGSPLVDAFTIAQIHSGISTRMSGNIGGDDEHIL